MKKNLVVASLITVAAFAAGMLFGYACVKDALSALCINPVERDPMSSM